MGTYLLLHFSWKCMATYCAYYICGLLCILHLWLVHILHLWLCNFHQFGRRLGVFLPYFLFSFSFVDSIQEVIFGFDPSISKLCLYCCLYWWSYLDRRVTAVWPLSWPEAGTGNELLSLSPVSVHKAHILLDAAWSRAWTCLSLFFILHILLCL